ncbi:MAG: hypothetical protein KDB53_16720, partial [Planctomycetes bacterium]|nr:hypothetical protein [Planctomycetota bacterium]
ALCALPGLRHPTWWLWLSAGLPAAIMGAVVAWKPSTQFAGLCAQGILAVLLAVVFAGSPAGRSLRAAVEGEDQDSCRN